METTPDHLDYQEITKVAAQATYENMKPATLPEGHAVVAVAFVAIVFPDPRHEGVMQVHLADHGVGELRTLAYEALVTAIRERQDGPGLPN